MNRKLAGLALASLALAGCGASADQSSPPPKAFTTSTFGFSMPSHCGIEYADFAGKTWKAPVPVPDPGGVENPGGGGYYSGHVEGTVTLTSPTTAYFEATNAKQAAKVGRVQFRVSTAAPVPCA